MKGKTAYKTIDEYISIYPDDVRVKLQKIREVIQKAAPDATEVIGYGIPTFKLNGNLVHFAAYKSHMGFYPASSGVAKFQSELSNYEMSKGTIRFPLNEPLPLDLISRIVKFRVNENLAKKSK